MVLAGREGIDSSFTFDVSNAAEANLQFGTCLQAHRSSRQTCEVEGAWKRRPHLVSDVSLDLGV